MSNPYDESPQQRGPYEQGQPQNPYGQQPSPYGQPQQYNPYGQQGSPYGGQQNPYGQQVQNPYGQQAPYGHDPYATNAPSAQQHDAYTESGQQHPGVVQGTHGSQPENPYAARQDPVSLSGEGQEAVGAENKLVEGSYGHAHEGYSQHDPYGQQAKSSAPAQPTPWQHSQPEQPVADDDATVLAPAGWSAQQRPAPVAGEDHDDDDATVLAPAGWSQAQPQASVVEDEADDATVLAPSGWSQAQRVGQPDHREAQPVDQQPVEQAQPGEQSLDSQRSGFGGLTRAERPSEAGVAGGPSAADPYAAQPASDPYAPAGYGQPSAADPYAAQPYSAQSASDPYAPQSYGQQSAGGPYAAQGYGQPSASDPYAAQGYGQQAPYSGQQFGQQQAFAEPGGNAYGYQQPTMGAPMLGSVPLDDKGMVPQGVLPSQLPPDQERSQASMAHWLGILLGWLGPLIIMLTGGEKSPWVKQHATESLNFHLTLLIGYLVSYVLMFVFVGWLTWLALVVLAIVFGIQGASAAGRGENYKYPFALRLIK